MSSSKMIIPTETGIVDATPSGESRRAFIGGCGAIALGLAATPGAVDCRPDGSFDYRYHDYGWDARP